MSVDEAVPPFGRSSSAFVTADPKLAAQVIQESYRVTGGVRISGYGDGFEFAQHVHPGDGFAVTRFQCNANIGYEGPLGGLLCVEQVHQGRLAFTTARIDLRTRAGDTCLVPPHEPWSAISEDIDLAPLVLDRARVAAHAAAISGVEPDALEFTGLEPISPGTVRYWNSAVAYVRDNILGVAEIADQVLIHAEGFRILATGILSMFPNNALAALADPRTLRAVHAEPSVIRRAVEFIDAHAHQPIGLTEIADAARVGSRSLQYAFRSHRGCTPMEYVKRVRMYRAHCDLRDADPTRGDTVAAIAARWGFAHAARFAAQYRATYGCSPSTTLRS